MPLIGTSQLPMVPGLTAEAPSSAIDLRRKPKLVHVDMQAKLSAMSFANVGAATLLKSKEVDELCAEAKRL